MSVKKYRYYYHYHRHGEKKLTVHFRGKCLQVNHIVCTVTCETKFNKRQPRLVMRGYCSKVTVKRGVATIL